jgi:oligoribonuclease NrnB/cAMP/cGMP phosphodiesterase (DHH superfamily)
MGRKVYVLYHGDKDGQAAAYAAWKKFGNTAEYIMVNYGQPIPVMDSNSEVYIVDFSYKEPIIRDLMNRMFKVVVLDHHKTAKEELAVFENETNDSGHLIKIDMSKSGCVLAWEYFHPNIEVPDLFKFVQDRDLWKFEFSETKAVHEFLCSFSFNFDQWNEWINSWQIYAKQIVNEGDAILRANEKVIKNICRDAYRTKLDSWDVIALNSKFKPSECADYLWSNHGTGSQPDFIVVYHDVNPLGKLARYGESIKRVFQLRCNGDFDVSVVARKFGGGGHKSAAGFTVPVL